MGIRKNLWMIVLGLPLLVLSQNAPDPLVNLALLGDATISSNITNGRGTPFEVLYDPAQGNYATITSYNEHGVTYAQNLGTPTRGNGFNWQVEWTAPKIINYITFGGTYPNQPQPNTRWAVSYYNSGIWTTLEEGTGGWIDRGTYEWGGENQTPITASKLLLELFSDGTNDLVSIHIRGRGGITPIRDTSAEPVKACLIQYLSSGNTISVAGVALNTSGATLAIGDSQSLIATVAPANASNQSVSWSSSDTAIASVTSAGEVTALAEGSASISVSTVDGGFTDSASITVAPDSNSGGNGSGSSGDSIWTETGTVASYNGKVGVGTNSVPAGYHMAIDGKIITEEVRVELSGAWPDYVFSEHYKLPTLEEIKKHIQEKGYLPNMPSAKEVQNHGIQVGEMNKLLLEKIEQLMLYTLKQQEEIEKLKTKINNQ